MALASSPVSAPSQAPPHRLEADTSRSAPECAGLVMLSSKNPPPSLQAALALPTGSSCLTLQGCSAHLPGRRRPSLGPSQPGQALSLWSSPSPLHFQTDTGLCGLAAQPGGDMKCSEACSPWGRSVCEDNKGITFYSLVSSSTQHTWPGAQHTGQNGGRSAGPAPGRPLAAVPEQLLIEM